MSTSLIPQERINELIDAYCASLDVKEKSRQTYKKGVLNFADWTREQGIATVTRADILAYKVHLQGVYSACTVSCYMTAVKSFYTYLEAAKISPNLAAGIKGAKASRGFKKDALTPAQANTMLAGIERDSLSGLRDYALVNLLIRTGLRTIEAQRANIEDMRSEAGQALLYIQGKGRDEKDAFVVLTEATLEPLREYLRARGKVRDSDPLFASVSRRDAGGRLTTRSISRIVKDALRAAGYDSDRLTAHSLRHSAVTFSLMGGASLQEAQQLARHSSINTTLIYAHNLNRIAAAPERRIDELLAQSGA